MKPQYQVLAWTIAHLIALRLITCQHKGLQGLNKNLLFLIKLRTERHHSWNVSCGLFFFSLLLSPAIVFLAGILPVPRTVLFPLIDLAQVFWEFSKLLLGSTNSKETTSSTTVWGKIACVAHSAPTSAQIKGSNLVTPLGRGRHPLSSPCYLLTKARVALDISISWNNGETYFCCLQLSPIAQPQ